MVIRHDCKLIFVHIPRTAGRSVEVFLKKLPVRNRSYLSEIIFFYETKRKRARKNGLLNMHSTAKQVKKAVGDYIWNSYYKFSIIRNPWDIMVSSYCYAKHQFDNGASAPNERIKAFWKNAGGRLKI